MANLKPCPFCGYPPHMDKHEIFCDCGVKMEFPLQEWGCSDKNPEGFPTYEQAKEVAVERWNAREAPTVDAIEVVRCADCAYYGKSPLGHPHIGWCRIDCKHRKSEFYCANADRK